MLLAAASTFLALTLPPVILNNIGWIIAGLIIVVGLFIIGIADVIRFSPRRLWAISGVCFDESIRRRILWITPLAILGVIVVAQLQKPIDEQDAIRQTTKFCLFATGLVVTISTIILACTNLPREIENRVIFTVVTKPTTRLEIVLGKIAGFARVSAAILLIMGLFTWGYLQFRAVSFQQDIRDRIKSHNVDPVSLPTLQHYADVGLLNAKTFATPSAVQTYARLPGDGDTFHYFTNESTVLIPFVLPADTAAVVDPENKSGAPGLFIHLHGIGYDPATLAALKPDAPSGLTAATRPITGPSPLVASTRPAGPTAGPTAGTAQVVINFFDPNQNTISGVEVNAGKPFVLTSPQNNDLTIPISAAAVASLAKFPYVYVTIFAAGSSGVQYRLDDQSTELIVPVTDQQQPQTVSPSDPQHPGQPGKTLFLGRTASAGQQIRGDTPDKAPVCVYSFQNANITASPVPIELRLGIERADENPNDPDAPTQVSLQVHNHKTGQFTDPVILRPENNRFAFAAIPSTAIDGQDFDVILRCVSPDHWITIASDSLQVVQAETPFAFNLFKSLLVIWLLAVLVITISIFSSTFLSWPIAVVFTLVILFGRWGVQELGDAATAGLGRQFVQDFGVRDPAQAQALSTTVEKLNQLLNVVATVLPDVSQFSTTEDIERGISLPAYKIGDALWVVLGFGLPLSVLAYVFLKNKEVAP